jgi:maltose O-acetyltransferase
VRKIGKLLFRGPIAVVRITWALASGIPLRILEILGQLFPENSWGCKIRGAIYRPFLKKCGRNFQVALSAKLEHLSGIEVGNDVYIGHGSWISGLRGGVLLEDEVMLGPFVTMISSNHTFDNGSARFGNSEGGHIEIGFGTWIASGVTVTAGVRVGRSCLLAAGAVVTMDIANESVAGGVPAKIIGSTPQVRDATDDEDR